MIGFSLPPDELLLVGVDWVASVADLSLAARTGSSVRVHHPLLLVSSTLTAVVHAIVSLRDDA